MKVNVLFSAECIQMAITCLTGNAALLLSYLIGLSFKTDNTLLATDGDMMDYSNYMEIPTLFPQDSSLSIVCNDQNLDDFYFFGKRLCCGD